MKLLLDTHILLWCVTNNSKLSMQARTWIDDPQNDIFYSLVSLWEVAIKHLISPERMPVSDEELSEYAEQSGIRCLNLSQHHISLLKTLHRNENAKPHHDPFDRMLICQAKAENMLLITHDSLIPDYGESCIVFV